MMIEILRLGHRHVRDKRMTTHIGLTARALGAEKCVYTGEHDSHIERSMCKIVKEWGGSFVVEHTSSAKKYIKKWQKEGGIVVHLTMFGLELSEKIAEIQKPENKLLAIIGGSKVPGEIFHLVDYNIAIGHQPHSELSALAIFLDRVTAGEGRKSTFPNGKIEIIPMERGKKTITKNME